MAKTDVVKHDLPKALLAAAQVRVDEDLEPVPFPRGPSRPRAEAVLVAPPVTSLVSDEERVTAPYRSVGKMGMIYTSGAKKYGTGWVVAKRAFITAGHCVQFSDFG